ncbi:MAG TPA: HD domain-containing protein [Bacteroidales bacterium]|nr:HD domain-containing protein [Bacteroidales bacterium]
MRLNLNDKILTVIAQVAHIHQIEAYVVGGYVRDLLLNRKSKDIDILVIGDGVALAENVAKVLNNSKVVVFKTFGTAQIKYNNYEIEFVGARKESYRHESRKPIVEQGSLEDDIYRRDFTINALAASLVVDNYGEVIDIYDGLTDLKNKIIKTPAPPEITFSDDPLRMMRAIRFSAQLQFQIDEKTLNGIKQNAHRIEIISKERIVDELNKILLSPKPSVGFLLLDETGLLAIILPELSELKGVEKNEGLGHKDNFYHTLQVVDQLREKTDKLWLLWAALLHDIGKPATKKFSPKNGWSFHGHEVVGGHISRKIFKRMHMPLQETLPYVIKLINLHLRPIALVSEEVTDSAVRRLIFDAGEDLEDLMLLAEADVTSKNEKKVRQYIANFKLVRKKMIELEERDKIRNFQPPISGEEIMKWFNLQPCKLVGDIKSQIKDAILDGIIPNDRKAAMDYLLKLAEQHGLKFDKREMD